MLPVGPGRGLEPPPAATENNGGRRHDQPPDRVGHRFSTFRYSTTCPGADHRWPVSRLGRASLCIGRQGGASGSSSVPRDPTFRASRHRLLPEVVCGGGVGTSQVPCPTTPDVTCEGWREVLSAQMDGEATPVERTPATAHLVLCSDCQRWLDQATEITRRVRVYAALTRAEIMHRRRPRVRRPRLSTSQRPWL
ncbi:zf-HC2 domain-containing protein [Micromonospora sp. WMMA1923]|uniref:zf-HC2 domain-containing protein n=1 Tax=Micromonospora sp. WMMA1923 TaxID=3404125 RepID=UPI003B9585AC